MLNSQSVYFWFLTGDPAKVIIHQKLSLFIHHVYQISDVFLSEYTLIKQIEEFISIVNVVLSHDVVCGGGSLQFVEFSTGIPLDFLVLFFEFSSLKAGIFQFFCNFKMLFIDPGALLSNDNVWLSFSPV